MQLTSPAFQHLQDIPSTYTCQSADVSPPLSWSGIPGAAKSLVLIVDDPDAPDPKAPRMVWAHWLLYNLPPKDGDLPEAVTDQQLPKGTMEGSNDWQRSGYGGPCPPIGKHRYFFRLYALDTRLPDLHGPDRQQLEQAIQGHVIEHTELVGLYEKE